MQAIRQALGGTVQDVVLAVLSGPGKLGAAPAGLPVFVPRDDGSKGGEGNTVSAGEILPVVEAMKMESSVAAPLTASITKIHVVAGEQIETGDLI